MQKNKANQPQTIISHIFYPQAYIYWYHKCEFCRYLRENNEGGLTVILDKKQMTEEDIKLQYITPAIQAKWGLDRMTMETKITDGRINLKGNLITREKPKKADYVLYLTKNKPIAIVEAKDNNHSISYGIQQAITYAQMMDVPFAYSSNGDGFQEHDLLTGLERTLSIDEFPSVDELITRFESEANGGAGVSDNERKIISQPYYSSQNTYDPRYYQRNAINRTVEAIAKGQDRILLVMATGTGKTYTAFQIVYRLLKSGLKNKVLYLADCNILVKSNPEFWMNGDIPWFTIEDVHRQGRFISTTEKYISKKALSKNTERVVPPNSVLLCCTASVGEYAYTKKSLTTNQQFNAFVTKPEFVNTVFPMYVYEYAKTLKDTLIKNAGKTTFNFLSVGKLSLLLSPFRHWKNKSASLPGWKNSCPVREIEMSA